MIRLYQSHSLTSLASEFSEWKPGEGNPRNPLEPVWVIVQNNEVKEWLSLKWAERQGIAGNFKFIFPSEFLWTLYRLVRNDIPKSLPSDLNAMQWALFDIFNNEPEFIQNLPVSKKGIESGFQLFYLSAQVADIFDQYQVYRPNMMRAWLNNESTTKHPDEKWQAAVWRRLNEYWGSDDKTAAIPSRADAWTHLIEWISGSEKKLMSKLPDSLYIFGLSQQSYPFLKIISHLGKLMEIKVYHRDILKEHEDEERNSLFKNWSNSVREQLSLLKVLSNEAGTKFETEHVSKDHPVIPDIVLNSCHSSRREVEVLKDAILHYLNDIPAAGPEDVLVMVPDADEYASLLESSFLEEEPSLPISKLYSKSQLLEHTLVAILDILNTSFKPSAVLSIINLKPVRDAFSFSDDELDVLEEWISENHMYRGLGDSFHTLHSWKKGVAQLLTGLSMQADSLALYKEMVPQPGIHSSDNMHLVARFSLFIHKLIEAAELSQEERSPLKWLKFVEQLVHDLLENESNGADASSLFLRITKLKEQVSFSSGMHPVSFGLIKEWLKSQFESNSSSSGRFGQGITVSSYVPYRSIPFRFIAVLGMNEGVFPRKTIHPDFDLIYAQPKPGDRIQKEDDSYLFLETLFAAKDKLHISYIGQDQRKDAELLPSVLVQQLKEVHSDQELITRQHSLHGFSTKYFKGEDLPRSFSKATKIAAQNLLSDDAKLKPFITEDFYQSDIDVIDQVSTEDLLSFFIHPSKYIVHNYLQISDKIYLGEVSDRELFDLDGLSTFQLSDFLLKNISADATKERIYDYARSAALIPDKLNGRKAFERQFQQVKELKNTYDTLSTEEPSHVDIQLEIEGIEVFGRISGIHKHTLILSRIGKRKAIHEIEQWLKHLLLLESGFPIENSFFISKEKTEVKVHELSSSNISNGILGKYVKWFIKQEPVLQKTAFFPETSKKYAETYLKEEDEEKALRKARSEWEASFNRTFVESNDYCNNLLWRARDPLSLEDFKRRAISFWYPFLEAQEGDNEHK